MIEHHIQIYVYIAIIICEGITKWIHTLSSHGPQIDSKPIWLQSIWSVHMKHAHIYD